MWQLTRVQAKNIVSFRELDLSIPQDVCTLIYGINADNENQKNNGSGKSSIIEAIAFGITGESIKKAPSLNDIINNYEEEASVSLTFHNDWNDAQFTVGRDISREGTQRIYCKLNNEEVAQSSVLEYNRYILETLGVTKDELYGCYLLNNARFKSFFLASDKDKKEIINTFSNGVLVDQAIEELQGTIDEANECLSGAKTEVTKINGSISAVDEQIVAAEIKALHAEEDKQNKIIELKRKIADVRSKNSENNENIQKANGRLKELDGVMAWLDMQEGMEQDFSDCFLNIRKKFEDSNIPQIKDYDSIIEKKNKEVNSIKEEIKAQNSALQDMNIKLKVLVHNKFTASQALEEYVEHNDELKATNEEMASLNKKLDEMDAQAEELEDKIAKYKKDIVKAEETINKLEVQINGAITCPNCKHKFLLDPDKNLSDLQTELADTNGRRSDLEKCVKSTQKSLGKCDSEYNKGCDRVDELKKVIDSIGVKTEEFRANLRKAEKDYNDLYDQADALESKLTSNQNKLEVFEEDIAMLRNRMFDEANSVVESRISSGKSYLESINSSITANNGIIEAYKQSIKDIENAQADTDIISNLKASKKKYEEELSEANKVLDGRQEEYDRLIAQKDYFVQFKSYLANKKIDSIASITNQFLAKIGSDMSIELSGYKVLKSKKVREKITMSILRDGVDGGDLTKFSGGERARISLAGILAMMHLTNNNAEDGKGLQLLVVDEVLDASDTSGIMSYAEAITSLGITSLLITQCPVNESYPNLLTVKKEGGISSIIYK